VGYGKIYADGFTDHWGAGCSGSDLILVNVFVVIIKMDGLNIKNRDRVEPVTSTIWPQLWHPLYNHFLPSRDIIKNETQLYWEGPDEVL
jgi:hypothetical protein